MLKVQWKFVLLGLFYLSLGVTFWVQSTVNSVHWGLFWVCWASGICQGRSLEVHGLETIWDFVGGQLSVTCDVCCVAVLDSLGFIGRLLGVILWLLVNRKLNNPIHFY